MWEKLSYYDYEAAKTSRVLFNRIYVVGDKYRVLTGRIKRKNEINKNNNMGRRTE